MQPVNDPAPAEVNPVLFTVGDSTVYADEFIYVYRKNNEQLDSAFTKPDVAEYLGLYENFKVKIMEAYARGYDSLQSYRDELATYTSQLKEPYLTETRITDELIEEAFERTREEIRASHILIRFTNNNPSPEDTLAAFRKISNIREMALHGRSFDSLAMKYSEDPSVKDNQGDLGYFTSMQMVYPFESAAYGTEINAISPIVRTRFGYHILNVTDRRPANGKVVVSHLMLRHQSDSAAVREQIFNIYDSLMNGADWDRLVGRYSEDVNSKKRNGLINPFGVGQSPLPFQEAAFALSERGEISKPVETQYGWHIIKFIEKRPLPELDDLRSSMERRISLDVRADLVQEYLVERLKSEWGFEENPEALRLIRTISDSTESMAPGSGPVLFSIGEKDLTLGDYYTFADAPGTKPVEGSGFSPANLYEEFKTLEIIAWEEANLEEKYPEYRMLLREYKEGILYFQLMEEEIWNRASEDSVGQRNYYEMHKEEYHGAPSASATVYAMPDSASAAILEKEIRKGESPDSALQMLKTSIQTQILPVEIYWEKGDQSPWERIPQQIGIYRENIMNKWYVVEVTEVNQDGIRPFNKSRGQVISDYQQYLEKEWVRKLKSKYPVRRNEKGV
ncbi:MAG: peptidylprolyl isomerase, partial [Cyclobacteriaceae bacterium]